MHGKLPKTYQEFADCNFIICRKISGLRSNKMIANLYNVIARFSDPLAVVSNHHFRKM